MKTWFALLAIVAAMVLMAGVGHVFAAQGDYGAGGGTQMTKSCQLEFQKMDSGNKGYLTYWDFRQGWGGDSQKGIMPTGSSYEAFSSIDRKEADRVTPHEYCAWKGQ